MSLETTGWFVPTGGSNLALANAIGRLGTADERRGHDLAEAPHALRDVADRCK